MLEENCINNFSFKVTLLFQFMKFSNSKFDIQCSYTLEIPNEENSTYKDGNILFIDDLSTSNGFGYLLSEIKERDE